MRRTLLTVALSILIAAPALAQQPLKLSFENGRVTVDANAVPVRTILNEWGNVGGTKVVGAERITGAPVTVKLVNVTEAQALETILRSVAGYMAAPRSGATTGPSIYDRILVMATSSAPAPVTVKLVNVTEAQALETILRSVAGYMAAPRSGATTGPSMYDRILVMATSSTPAPPANAARPSPAQPNAFAGTQRFVPPRQRAEEPEEIEEPDENPPAPPVFTFPQPPQNMAFPQQPGAFGNIPAGVAQPGMIVPAPQTITINPAQGYPVPQPQLPIGVAQPGMMVPAPQQPQRGPTQPTVVIRPPGAN